LVREQLVKEMGMEAEERAVEVEERVVAEERAVVVVDILAVQSQTRSP
jgi:hypothetical protein